MFVFVLIVLLTFMYMYKYTLAIDCSLCFFAMINAKVD